MSIISNGICHLFPSREGRVTNALILKAALDMVSLGHIDHCQINTGFRTDLSSTTCKEKVNHRSFIDSCETWVVLVASFITQVPRLPYLFHEREELLNRTQKGDCGKAAVKVTRNTFGIK